jgi:ADP-ribosylglycohydrolase
MHWLPVVSRVRQIASRVRGFYHDTSPERHELDEHIRADDDSAVTGSGYVVDCLRSARRVLSAGGYVKVVRAAVSLGNDTDTTACVAGGLAGVREGVDAIPSTWRDRLRKPELFAPLLEQLAND